ncbi:condensation domain-containing protein [Dimargaris cristalligena]|uniref:Condensation domain-containing protein n=1 Tax=Dimargaris cristalligena TaxID=215637 RepID=A0A4P9ZY96_9FUNG|nr:condensation domain-containing protein [Dimargaris cristalligena]|eukprot:RKP38647.1 condensation domain-containing protein [Dimargaris cristalligena]
MLRATDTLFKSAYFQLSDTETQAVVNELANRQIPLSQVEDFLPCISAQSAVLMDLTADPTAYHIQLSATLTGPLEVPQLIQAWNAVSEQHAPLRSHFIELPGRQTPEFAQVVLRSCPTAWVVVDEPLSSLDAFLMENNQRGFCIKNHMVHNFVFPTMDTNVHILVLSLHHSLMDGLSLFTLLKLLLEAYHCPQLAVPPPAVTHAVLVDHVHHQVDPLQTQTFWINYLQDALPTPAPPSASNHVGVLGHTVYITKLDVSKEALYQFAERLGITVTTLLRAAYAVVLGRLLDQNEVTFKTFTSGRRLNLPAMDQTIGPCINMLPFRVRLGHSTIESWLLSLEETDTNLAQFEYTSPVDIFKWTAAASGKPPTETPYATEMGYDILPDSMGSNPTHNLKVSDVRFFELIKSNLVVDFFEKRSSIDPVVFYNTKLYTEASIDRMVGFIQHALVQIVNAPPNTTVNQIFLDGLTLDSTHTQPSP